MKPIKTWGQDDRPREKLRMKGAGQLTDAEILAIIIQNGTKEKTAVASNQYTRNSQYCKCLYRG